MVAKRSGSSPKGSTPNIHYFAAKPKAYSIAYSIVAIYVLFEELSGSFWRACFRRVLRELSTKVIMLWKSFQ